MNINRIFLLLMSVLCFTGVCNAECWVNTTTSEDETPIYLDIDSIKTKGENTYFNIMYYTDDAKSEVIYMMNLRGTAIGTVKSCSLDKYLGNRLLMNTLLGVPSKKQKPVSLKSKLYNAYRIVILPEAHREQYRAKGQELNDQKEPDFNPYMSYLYRRIKSYWQPTRLSQKYSVVMKLEIAKDGQLLSCEVIKSSGMKMADIEAVMAAKKASPYRALPKEFLGDKIEIQFTLDYEMFVGAEQELE